MTDDALSALVDAYRAEHSARSLDRRALRERVVLSAGRRRVRRAERLRLAIAFAATFVGSAALAASPPLREHVREAFSFVRSGETARSVAGARGAPERSPRIRTAPPAAPSPVEARPLSPPVEATPVASSPVEPAPAVTKRPPARREAPPRALSSDVPAPSSTASFEVTQAVASPSNRDLMLYRRAHELHFGGGDQQRALAAWDAYLKAFPRGTFAPEARLNRAVCLAKLGRKAEAEGVLLEIERGRFGEDGRRQARKILGVLDED